MGWRAVPALLIVPVLVLGACGGDGEEGSEPVVVCPSEEAEATIDVSDLTLGQVYERMTEAMTCPGYALHVVLAGESQLVFAGDSNRSTTLQEDMWLDVASGRARAERHTILRSTGQYGEVAEDREDRGTFIWVGDIVYSVHQLGTDPFPARGRTKADFCEGSENYFISSLLPCATEAEESTTRFEPVAEYRGRTMPALITEGEAQGEIGGQVSTSTAYLDEGSLLPLSATIESAPSEDENPAAPHSTHTLSFEYEFVTLDSLAQDFFDPASIEPDPEEGLRGVDLGITVYWLGVDFSGANGLPELSLRDARPADAEGAGPGYRTVISYALAEDRFGSAAIGVQEYPREEWDARLARSRGNDFWDWPCTQRSEVSIGDRRALIYGGYHDIGPSPECPQEPPDQWGAYVYLDDTVALIDALAVPSPAGEYTQSPYNSYEGMEAVVRALVPYE